MNFDNLDSYKIAYDKIVNDTTMLPTTRLLASKLQNNPYLTVKDFLEGLSDEEVFTLLEIADEMVTNFEACDHGKDLVLIGEMLVRAEGLISANDEEVAQRTNSLCSFIACEGLARRGLVQIFRQNMSFGEEMLDKTIVKAIPGINYDDMDLS